MSQLNPIVLEALRDVLDPMDAEMRDDLLARVGHEMESRPIIVYCSDKPRTVYEEVEEDDGQGGKLKRYVPQDHVNVWRVGSPSPVAADTMIFGMAFHEGIPAVLVWTVRDSRAEGDGDLTRVEYFREVIRNFDIIQGPVTAKALYLDMCNAMIEEDDLAAIAEKLRDAGNGDSRLAKLADMIDKIAAEDDDDAEPAAPNGKAARV